MAAAERLFSEYGYHVVNSNQIAKEAGVSVGSFYSYFKDKKSLLLEILDSFYSRFRDTIFNLPGDIDPSTLPLKTAIRHYIQNTFSAFEIAPDFMRATYSMLYYDPDVQKLYKEGEKLEKEKIRELFHRAGDKISVKDKDAAVMVVYSATANIAHRLILLGLEMDKQRLIEELIEMLTAYLSKQ